MRLGLHKNQAKNFTARMALISDNTDIEYTNLPVSACKAGSESLMTCQRLMHGIKSCELIKQFRPNDVSVQFTSTVEVREEVVRIESNGMLGSQQFLRPVERNAVGMRAVVESGPGNMF